MDLDKAEVQKLYDNNLQMLMDKISKDRRGMWRVMMADTGLIVSIAPCRPGKPQENCFTLFVPGNGKKATIWLSDLFEGVPRGHCECFVQRYHYSS
mmetsp:Transcript_15440/g.25230  ORF Transcript_15440/g.25230 Transcript_15440/m.25230 type:complete len:96 (+) Transcript_15440:424-711(+)